MGSHLVHHRAWMMHLLTHHCPRAQTTSGRHVFWLSTVASFPGLKSLVTHEQPVALTCFVQLVMCCAMLLHADMPGACCPRVWLCACARLHHLALTLPWPRIACTHHPFTMSCTLQSVLSRRMNLATAVEDAAKRILAAAPPGIQPDLAIVWVSSAFADKYEQVWHMCVLRTS